MFLPWGACQTLKGLKHGGSREDGREGGGGGQVALGSNPISVAHLFSKPVHECGSLQLWTTPLWFPSREYNVLAQAGWANWSLGPRPWTLELGTQSAGSLAPCIVLSIAV